MLEESKNELISLQAILKKHGYYTSFINTEPENLLFTRFLKEMEFDELISNKQDSYKGYSKTLSDGQAYDLLFSAIEKQSNSNVPFFTAIYTFGTHVSLDSSEEKYGDGSNAELNKFYNADYHFGEFMRKFNESDISENTIIIFTADHCTYDDDGFSSAFPDVNRKALFLDRIPLFIYYKGINAGSIDAFGRNSVDLAPTILDYLDISDENYFLGRSLFRDIDDSCFFDTYYVGTGGSYYSTKGGTINAISEDELDELTDKLKKYYSLKLYSDVCVDKHN